MIVTFFSFIFSTPNIILSYRGGFPFTWKHNHLENNRVRFHPVATPHRVYIYVPRPVITAGPCNYSVHCARTMCISVLRIIYIIYSIYLANKRFNDGLSIPIIIHDKIISVDILRTCILKVTFVYGHMSNVQHVIFFFVIHTSYRHKSGMIRNKHNVEFSFNDQNND